ncbi:hypothetical protein RB601_008424 [Gaeumannomyces tritici]
MYFLPNGTWDDCMRHYRTERDARGSYTTQAEAAESSAAAKSTAETARIPGLVPSYARHDMERFEYHAVIYICDADDWRGGDNETITRLEFEPLSREDYERYNKCPDGGGHEPDVLPETAVVVEAISRLSPGFEKPTPARPRQAGFAGTSTEMHHMSAGMRERVPYEHDGASEWLIARDNGWTHW